MGIPVYSWSVKNAGDNLGLVTGVLNEGSLSIQVDSVRIDRTELYCRTPSWCYRIV